MVEVERILLWVFGIVSGFDPSVLGQTPGTVRSGKETHPRLLAVGECLSRKKWFRDLLHKTP